MEDMRDWHVLVTGATGLTGSWLVRHLLGHGVYVVVLARSVDPQSELYRSGDALRCYVVNGHLEHYPTVERAINEHEIDTVFHLGAHTIVGNALRSPMPVFEANVRGTYHVLEACRHHDVKRIIVASSDKAYGARDTLPYTEDDPLLGRFPYDVSKACADLLAQAYHHTYGLPVIITRCANIYGGGDMNWNRLVPGTIRSLLRGQRPIIRSDGSYMRDYIYVEDTVSAYLLLAGHMAEYAGHAFNIGTETPASVLDMVTRITQLLGIDLGPDIKNQAAGEIRDQWLSTRKIRQRLGWKPFYSRDEGLARTIAWYREYFNHDA